jgi:Immunoglobulin domain
VAARIISFGGLIVRPWRSSVALNCIAVGTPRRDWRRADQLIKGGANQKQQLLDSGELILTNLQLSDSGNYTCHVDNGQGSDKIIYNLIVQVSPDAPLLYVTSATSSSILLHWKGGNNGGAPISGFTLNYKREHGDIDEIHLSRHSIS